jgi:hypothetical protein
VDALDEHVVVGTIDANSGAVTRRGAIGQVKRSRYVVLVDGMPAAQAPTLDRAAHRLAVALRNNLPHGHANWGVEVHCLSRSDVALLFGNRRRGGPGGRVIGNPCVLSVAEDYRHGEDVLGRALEFAARLLASCCSE